MTISIPSVYAEWRDSRNKPMGKIISKTSTKWTLSVRFNTLRAIVADTRYYARGGLGNVSPSVVRSAKTSLRILIKTAQREGAKIGQRALEEAALTAKLNRAALGVNDGFGLMTSYNRRGDRCSTKWRRSAYYWTRERVGKWHGPFTTRQLANESETKFAA